MPIGQSVQTDWPVEPWYLPARQSAHVVATEAPVAAENLPAAQGTQESEVPTVVRYLPATQLMHMLAAAAVHLPVGHETQEFEVDVPVKYLPATQAVQVREVAVPMAGPQYPLLQVHEVLAPLANADAALLPQVKQSDAAVLAVKAL